MALCITVEPEGRAPELLAYYDSFSDFAVLRDYLKGMPTLRGPLAPLFILPDEGGCAGGEWCAAAWWQLYQALYALDGSWQDAARGLILAMQLSAGTGRRVVVR